MNVIKQMHLPTFSPVTKEGRMSIFCSSLPNTWTVNHFWAFNARLYLDWTHEDAVVGSHDGSSAPTATTEYNC